MDAEISYDLVMVDNMAFVEGCYRIPARPWEVFTVTKKQIAEVEYRLCEWDSGVTGVAVRVPREMNLNRTQVERLLSANLAVGAWREVRGPDSIVLR